MFIKEEMQQVARGVSAVSAFGKCLIKFECDKNILVFNSIKKRMMLILLTILLTFQRYMDTNFSEVHGPSPWP